MDKNLKLWNRIRINTFMARELRQLLATKSLSVIQVILFNNKFHPNSNQIDNSGLAEDFRLFACDELVRVPWSENLTNQKTSSR